MNATVKICESCGNTFYVNPGDEWKRQCLECWKRSKRKEEGRTDETALLRSKINKLSNDVDYWRDRAYAAEEKMIDTETLTTIRMLCHPDKHNGSKSANKITSMLNNLITNRRHEPF